MTVKEKIAVSILLLVARWFAGEPWAAEIKSLSTHISVYVKEGTP